MKSHEVLKQSVEDVGVKTIASDLGSPLPFFTNGANQRTNPRIAELLIRSIDWLKYLKPQAMNKLFLGFAKKQTVFSVQILKQKIIRPKSYFPILKV